MATFSGSLDQTPIHEVILAINGSSASGVLEIVDGDQRRRLHFVGGDLYLVAGHPLARRLRQDLEGTDGLAMGAARLATQISELMGRLVDAARTWRRGSFRFDPNDQLASDDLVGPVPALRFGMELALARLESDGQLEKVADGRSRWVVDDTSPLLVRRGVLTPEELFVVERLRQFSTFERALERSTIPPRDAVAALARLKVVGIVHRADEPGRLGGTSEEAVLDASLIERFRERIAASLRQQPLETPFEAHQARVMNLVRRIGAMTHYNVLSLKPGDGPELVQAAFEELARLVHPSHVALLGETLRPALNLLFERATLAYLVLSDPQRRREYDLELGVEIAARPMPQEVRPPSQEEKRGQARLHFERAQKYAARGDHHGAIQLLELAVRHDRTRAEYFVELARQQAQNPNWLRLAAASYRRALELEPRNVATHVALAEILEQSQEIDEARQHFEIALQLDPANALAGTALIRLREVAKPGSSWLRRIFGRS